MKPTTEPRPWTELQVLREDAGQLKGEFAARVGLTPGYYGELENGRREPNARIVKQIADALGVPVSRISKLRRAAEDVA